MNKCIFIKQNNLTMKKILFILGLLGISFIYCSAQTTAKDWFDKGTSLQKEVKYQDAVTAYKKAVELLPAFSEAWHQLGWCYNELGRFNDAIDAFKKEELNNPKDPASTHFEIGFAYQGLEKYDEAIGRFTAAISLDKVYASAYKERSNCYFIKQESQKALDDINEYTSLIENVQDPDFYYQKGWCENDLKKYGEAINSLKKALELKSDFTEAKADLGFAYFKLKRYDDALEIFQQMMNKDQKDELARYYAGFCYYYKKDQANLKKMIDELQKINTEASQSYAETLKALNEKNI